MKQDGRDCKESGSGAQYLPASGLQTGPGCRLSLGPCPAAADLRSVWRDLESRSNGSVFLSWPWIGSALEVFEPKAKLAQITKAGGTIGLAIIGVRPTFIPHPFATPSFHLNETGDPSADSIMIEYNGVLTESGMEDVTAKLLVDSLLAGENTPEKTDVIFSGVTLNWLKFFPDKARTTHRLNVQLRKAPFANLSQMDSEDVLRSLSRNTREQIRRSIRFFEQLGPLTFSRATQTQQALDWFSDLERLHTASWTARGKIGAFHQQSFAKFHRHLIKNFFEEGVPDLFRLQAGDTVLGYLYNLRWRGIASAYQSGFVYGPDPRWRPGLVAHVMAMKQYQREGFSIYRFLAGDARYKNSLAPDSDDLYWIECRKPSLLRDIENQMRRLWQVLCRPPVNPERTP